MQNSSFVMEESQGTNAASAGKHVRDAFCVSISYKFCHRNAQKSVSLESAFSAIHVLILFSLFVVQVVGSVLYFTTFCLDKLGQPLLNENPQLTEGWDVPKYP